MTTSSTNPSQDDTVYSISADREDDHGDVARNSVHGDAADDETDDCDGFGGCDVPCSLVVLSGLPGPVDGDDACNQILISH